MKILFFTFLLTTMFSAANADFLDRFRWEKRVILLDFPEGSEDALSEVERQIRKSRDAIRERDLVLFHLGELGSSGRSYAGRISNNDRQAVRRQWQLGDDSEAPRLILIGKDGGIKATQEKDFDLQKFFDLIDTMPMRRREMREG